MQSKVEYVKLVGKTCTDHFGYQTLVFQKMSGSKSYIMCTKFPNWDSSTIKINDIGYLKYREVIAGKDTWFDSENNQYIPYKNTDCHFINFVHEPKVQNLLITE